MGLLEGFFNRTSSNETILDNDVIANIVSVLKVVRAVIVPINEIVYNTISIGRLDV